MCIILNTNEFEFRAEEFKRNTELEIFLKEINGNLKAAEEKLLAEEIKEYPVVFIVGSLRSGTTLMEQWLADTGEFAYPSNIMSRFYGAPILGSKIQRLLTDSKYNFRNEIMEFKNAISFESNNGKTRGALEPNEFWYFWRRFLPEDMYKYSDEDLLECVDVATMTKEMWGISQVFDKPFALKGLNCNYNIGFLNKIFPQALFIWTRRNLENNTRSVLEARKRQYGTYNHWYSFIIPEYEELMKIENMEEQVRKQICCINNAIEKGLGNVPEEKKVSVKYEDFCASPEKVYREIYKKLSSQGYAISEKYNGANHFTPR